MTPSAHSAVLPPRTNACALVLRGFLVVLALVFLLGVAAWLGRSSLMRAAADAWIVSDEVRAADAVAVFGGGLELRPFAAAEYYHRGLVGKILISNVGASPAETLGVLQSHVKANRAVLLKLGVPDSAIESFGFHLGNTSEEALALRDWVMHSGARTIIVPTEIFSTRRVRWMLDRVFAGRIVVLVPALEPLGYGRDNWWTKEAGVIGFQNEVVKYIFYRLHY